MTARTTTALTIALVAAAGTPAALGGPTITEVAPPSTVFVVGIDDFASAQKSFESSGFQAIWNDPEVQQFLATFLEENSSELGEIDEMLDRLGFTRDDFTAPTGAVGFAVYLDEDAVDPMESVYHMVMLADFGENADTTHGFLESALEQGVEEGDITLESDTYRDATVWTIGQPEGEEDDDDDWEGDDWDDWDDWDEGGEGAWDTMYYARAGSTLMVSSSLAALETGIDRAEGDMVDGIGDEDGFMESLDAVGGEPQVYVAGMFGPMYGLTQRIDDANANAGGMGMGMPPIMTLLNATGLGEVEGFALGIDFDTAEAAIEQNIAVMMPERRGLLGLIPDQPTAFTAPDFVPANASGLSMVQFELSRLLPTIQQIAGGLPPEIQQQVMGPVMMASGLAAPIFNNLGPEVYIVSSIERPFSATSQQSVVAIKSRDTDALQLGLGGILSMVPIPVEQREFAGNTIWELPEDMAQGMGPGMGLPGGGGGVPVMGIGAGHMFLGTREGVEAAMRTASNADAPRLADEPRFKAAMENLRNDGLSFSWTNLRDSLEYAQWSIENRDLLLRQQLEAQFGDGPDAQQQIDEMMQWMGDDSLGWLDEMPSLDIFFEHFGDTVGDIRLTNRGIIGKYKTLRAE